MKTKAIITSAAAFSAALALFAQETPTDTTEEQAPAAEETTTAQTAEATEEAAPEEPASQEATDDIDLEEVDDSADAAKSAQISATMEGEIQYVDISCDDATIADVLRQFRKTTNANIISQDSTNMMKRVSAELKHVPWLVALQSILNSRGFRLEERGSIYFVDEDKQDIPIRTKTFTLNHASADELAKLFNENYGTKDNSGRVVKKIANAFEGANVVIVTGTDKVIADCENIIKSVDKAIAQIYIEARFLELSNQAMRKLGVQWDSLESWGASVKGLRAGLLKTDGKAANYGSALTTGNQNDNSTDTSNENVSYDKDGNKTTTSTRSPNTTITKTLTYTGLFPQQINEAPGAGMDAADMAWRSATGFAGQLSADDFRLAMSAFEKLGEGKMFSNPKIIVSNGKEAKVDMTTKEPNVSIEANYTGANSQNMSISTRLETIPGEDKYMFAKEAFFSWGISLTVKPRISPDGLISVEIVPTISDCIEHKEIQGGEQAVYTKYPIISVKRLTTEFTMKDGSTAVIGGLTQTKEEDVDSGIPYLRKIPWIGQKLFGWTSRQKVQSEIIVCVTVGIANPAELPKDIGLPKNAVLGREYIEGRRLEPGDRDGAFLEIDTDPLDKQADKRFKAFAEKKAEEQKRGSVTITPSQE